MPHLPFRKHGDDPALFEGCTHPADRKLIDTGQGHFTEINRENSIRRTKGEVGVHQVRGTRMLCPSAFLRSSPAHVITVSAARRTADRRHWDDELPPLM
ncbi:hypothetical protein Pure05_03330 [Paenarthrobacter ureafaciens]|nr:hypothetical protein Pure01_13480 [Paenarthrobacter ureafaciens]GLU62083.1 hypothetical protein Pure02_03330 [Paenarthrobacter ureafaciens]GLU66357.1 hypothetical protein Pure03_03330 [Paenarthrobacter ureafaciens]GLU71320.1 hypothetical protein Pure04_10350 [Paenarthrobacter ureafaciens]GLU74893.1 hypothetical protein Pure05_03330 [Paenarthrobacter ureafaciens]